MNHHIKLNASVNNTRRLIIPFFQRSYVWKRENWERFLEDMEEVSEKNITYFMGSFILKQLLTESASAVGDMRFVIDGQQRLTTLFIFFKILYEKNIRDFESMFINRKDGKVVIEHNYMDRTIFEAIIHDDLHPELEETYKDNNVLLCYNYFKENSERISKINGSLLEENLYFNIIDVLPSENEQQIFDTINSLGVRLTTAELLKNYFYKHEDLELYKKTWQKTFEKDQVTFDYWATEISSGRLKRTNLEIMLQSFLVVKMQGTDFKISNLFSEYQKYLTAHEILKTPLKKQEFIDELISYARSYSTNIKKDFISESMQPLDYISRINIIIFHLEITTIIPYFLYVLTNQKDSSQHIGILQTLESYIMRRFACNSSTKNYNNIFARAIKEEVLTEEKLKNFLGRIDTDDEFPSDDHLKYSFENIKLSNKTAKGILYLLELSSRSKCEQNILKAIKQYDLEHIMPTEWEENWPTDNQELRKNKINTIGNLTILSGTLNKIIKNSSWNDKKSGKGKWKGLGLEKYGSGLETFSEYILRDKWDENEIDSRAIKLYNIALKVWSI